MMRYLLSSCFLSLSLAFAVSAALDPGDCGYDKLTSSFDPSVVALYRGNPQARPDFTRLRPSLALPPAQPDRVVHVRTALTKEGLRQASANGWQRVTMETGQGQVTFPLQRVLAPESMAANPAELALAKRIIERARSPKLLQKAVKIAGGKMPTEVEVGAWRITLKNGEVRTAIYSSADKDAIHPEQTNKAFNAFIQSIPDGQVAFIQYFHNHPNKSPLSPQDAEMWSDLKRQLKAADVDVPMYMYAIAETDGDVFVRQFGLP